MNIKEAVKKKSDNNASVKTEEEYIKAEKKGITAEQKDASPKLARKA